MQGGEDEGIYGHAGSRGTYMGYKEQKLRIQNEELAAQLPGGCVLEDSAWFLYPRDADARSMHRDATKKGLFDGVTILVNGYTQPSIAV